MRSLYGKSALSQFLGDVQVRSSYLFGEDLDPNKARVPVRSIVVDCNPWSTMFSKYIGDYFINLRYYWAQSRRWSGVNKSFGSIFWFNLK